MIIAIVGLGLIGGSVARDLARTGLATSRLGVDSDPGNLRTALELGLVDRALPLAEAVTAADLIILAVPVDAIFRILPGVLDRISDRQTVVDLGSTKQLIVDAVRGHPRRARFVAAHPMAGTEDSGPAASRETLFAGRAAILCDTSDSAPDALATAERLFTVGLGMRLLCLDAACHDLHAAYVSHLPHVLAYALALAALNPEHDAQVRFSLAAGGFTSTARLAKSGPAMWYPILSQNRTHLLGAIAAFRAHLDAITHAITDGDSDRIRALITEANRIRAFIA
ncbi:MAG: prephenate dehydrogenase [Lentisphaerae bacterium]|nr:prephenate dehydrogenase [Lentisphaerota bacterium]